MNSILGVAMRGAFEIVWRFFEALMRPAPENGVGIVLSFAQSLAGQHDPEAEMAEVTYEVIEHNGGFAYRVGDVFSETFATHHAAHRAAEEASQRQLLSGDDEVIQYQDANGDWHEETSAGDSRPAVDVEDDLPEDLDARDRDGRILAEDEVPNLDRAPVGGISHR